jgi:hypothetical protein
MGILIILIYVPWMDVPWMDPLDDSQAFLNCFRRVKLVLFEKKAWRV